MEISQWNNPLIIDTVEVKKAIEIEYLNALKSVDVDFAA
jgi:hypothetical protein